MDWKSGKKRINADTVGPVHKLALTTDTPAVFSHNELNPDPW